MYSGFFFDSSALIFVNVYHSYTKRCFLARAHIRAPLVLGAVEAAWRGRGRITVAVIDETEAH